MTETTASTTATSDCRRCHGSGQIRAGLTCPACKGTGLNVVKPDDLAKIEAACAAMIFKTRGY
jgi:DnaJ-class molecular chaperone